MIDYESHKGAVSHREFLLGVINNVIKELEPCKLTLVEQQILQLKWAVEAVEHDKNEEN